ncbi:hypothetical protein ACVXZ0_07925 [Staphylococcus aureus]
MATVYRTLELLVTKLSTKLTLVMVACFDLRKEGAKHFHHHLVNEMDVVV